MQDGDFVAEDLVQIGGYRRRESDFRHEQDGGAAGFEHGTHAREVDGSFAGARDSVQKDAGKLSGLDPVAQMFQGGLLRCIEIECKGRRPWLTTRDSKSCR